mgnify:CR=1 FL=1
MEHAYFLNGSRVTLINEFTYNKREYCVVYTGDDWFEVCKKSDLKKWEETYRYQEEQKQKARAELWKKYESKIIERMQNKAISGIANRLKLNAFFGKGGGKAYAVVISEEIEKLIKKEELYDIDQHVQKVRKDT